MQVQRTCSFEGCSKPHDARGLCHKHWKQWRQRAGFPVTPRLPVLERFWLDVKRTDDCWLWTGYVVRSGYGSFSVNRRKLSAHRVAYELLVGPIPDGLTIDHLCHSRGPGCDKVGRACLHRRCVNPDHMEPVTFEENLRRRRRIGRPRRPK